MTCTHRGNWYVTCSWPFHKSPVIYGANSVLISMCFTVVIVNCRFREYPNRNSWRLLGYFFCRKWRMHVEIWSHITIFGRQCDYFGRYVQRWQEGQNLCTRWVAFLCPSDSHTYLNLFNLTKYAENFSLKQGLIFGRSFVCLQYQCELVSEYPLIYILFIIEIYY